MSSLAPGVLAVIERLVQDREIELFDGTMLMKWDKWDKLYEIERQKSGMFVRFFRTTMLFLFCLLNVFVSICSVVVFVLNSRRRNGQTSTQREEDLSCLTVLSHCSSRAATRQCRTVGLAHRSQRLYLPLPFAAERFEGSHVGR
jgi:hypothetical protein